MPAPFRSILIEGNSFDVLGYDETDVPDAGTHQQVLVRLTPEEHVALWSLYHRVFQAREGGGDPLWQVQRDGIDRTAVALKPGPRNWWSRHEENGAVYYKQIINLLPPNLPRGEPSLALGLDLEVVSRNVTNLSERFEALLDALEKSGTLQPNVASTLHGEWVSSPLSDEQRADEVMWRARRVEDAEAVMGQ